MKINFLLGAGFSKPAKFPSGNELNGIFFNKVENRIIKHSSAEWAWDDYDSAISHNGKLNYDYLKYSYLLSELVEEYQLETFKTFDYEEFYDWLMSKWGNKKFMKDRCRKVNLRLINEFKIEKSSTLLFNSVDINQYIEIYRIYNFLIADILNRDYESANNKAEYNNFIKLVSSADDVSIFTLNHDSLVEFLFKEYNLKFSDGFSSENSCLIDESGQKVESFSDLYDEKTKLVKLHGSINYYCFDYMNQEGSLLTHTGNFAYYKTDDFYLKHRIRRIDPETGKIIQNFTPNYVPQFLTGKNKQNNFVDNWVYKSLYKRFESSFNKLDLLVIIGYSFRDTHINSLLKTYLDYGNFPVVNVNPGANFPFRRNYNQNGFSNIKCLREL